MSSELHIISSNHLERLVDAIATLMASPLKDPLEPETVLVQSKGMQQWMSMAIAERNGICANINFPFPNAFLTELYEHVVGQLPSKQLFSADVLTFRIMQRLPELLVRDEFEGLRSYLNDLSIGRKQFQLATKIADALDQYQIFRPEMILKWEVGQYKKKRSANAWQPILWNALIRGNPSFHRAAQQKLLIDKLKQQHTPVKRLPSRISVFGISHLPPFHLRVLEALSHQIPVYMFLLNPCRHYWSDILSDRQINRSAHSQNNPELDQKKDLHIERGNRILASWGGQGKQFLNLIHQMDGQLFDLFADNTPHTLLGKIQQDILDLHDRSITEKDSAVVKNDISLQVHACHSPMREVEVLRDQLLDLFEKDPSISPRDVLVMTPDIGSYAPYIHAVFNNPLSDEPVMPYTVADQGMSKESRLIDGYLRLLELHQSRFSVSQVMALLAYPHIRRKFALEESDLPKIEVWLNSAQIRWGWNGDHRKAHALPRFEQNTWRHGLDRLIMGYAMAGDGVSVFNGILPQEDVDSGEGMLIGALSDFVEKLYRQLGDLPEKGKISYWHGILIGLLDDFFKIDESSVQEMRSLRDIIDNFLEIATVAEFNRQVPFEVVQDHIKGALNRSSFGTGFMRGSITFCAMLPMRSIPSKVICIMGMGYDTFPKDMREPAFNLIAAEPAAGDRSKRDDDKYLFLEALISARQVLYLSYVGRSVQDNSPIPPSVVIDELLEYVEAGFGVQASHIVTLHPLQAFSKSYFTSTTPELYSYSKENLEASQAMAAMDELPPFFQTPIEAPDESWRDCTLDQLCVFYTNPTRFILEQRLGIYLYQGNAVLVDHENFNINALDRFKIKQFLLSAHLEGEGTANRYESLHAAGVLPHGTIGRVLYQQIEQEVDQFANRLIQHTPDGAMISKPFEIDIGPYHLSGELDQLYPNKRLVYRLANIRPQDRLSLFIAHLVMAAVTTEEAARSSVLVCQDAHWELPPLDNPHDRLHDYLDLYWQGLQMPVTFFPKSSYEFALKQHQGKTSQQAIAASRAVWQGNPPYRTGENQDPYLNLCFNGMDPLNDEFKKLALRVYLPFIGLS